LGLAAFHFQSLAITLQVLLLAVIELLVPFVPFSITAE